MSRRTTTINGITPDMSDTTKQLFIDELGRIADQIRTGEVTEINIDLDRDIREKPTSGQWMEYESVPGVHVTVTVRS